MTATDRIETAAGGQNVVISVPGLLASFNDSSALSPLDVHAATVIARLCGETDQRVILAAALAVRGTRFGHVCIRLATQREVMVVEGQHPEIIEALPWPDPDEWESVVAGSRIVGDGGGDEPLVLVDDRLYLERYFRYEDRVVGLIDARTAAPPITIDREVRSVLHRLLPSAVDGGPNRQRSAVATALSGRLTVIAGGPRNRQDVHRGEAARRPRPPIGAVPSGGAVCPHREGSRPSGRDGGGVGRRFR